LILYSNIIKDLTSENDWMDALKSTLADFRYSKEKETNMERLLSITSREIFYVSQDFCFYSKIIALCLMKCWTFKSLVRSFGLKQGKISEERWKKEIKLYDTSSTSAAYKNNFKTAVQLTYGENISQFELDLADAIVKLNMSAGFDPATSEKLLNIIAANHVP
jgi:hypothetical protein